ncbi:hypothetical protein [Lapillicoccus sp.]|uniref:hypothetical protein n=1 Tax=Lapillicoccus sp. TaxID=1909287 RepID=UPI0025FC2106|nr:hypothetical protein [Lapillicoccus sp.]
MWKVEVSGDARTVRETVWAWYEATDLAPSWDPLIERIESEGPIELGVRGRNHPARGPAAPFVYSQVTPLISYTEVSSAPGAAFAFTHGLSDLPGGLLRITHGAEVSGPLAWLYRPLMQRRFHKGMRVAMDNLVQRVEAGPPTSTEAGTTAAG